MRFSVVIPTYNRCEKLKACLEALFVQEYDKSEFEIIVVDDGSQDSTQKTLAGLQKKTSVSLRAFLQPNQGQGVARNRGIENAQGEIILFLGDDIIVSSQLLKEHDRLHKTHPEENAAVLGFIGWHSNLEVTPLMEFMVRGGAIFGRLGGHQFAFDLLEGKEKADYRFFYTSNISLKRPLLSHFKFDPWFSGYGWEDIELGYRLAKQAGLVLYYNSEAIAYHDHPMDDRQWAQRMRDIGLGSHVLNKKYPQLGRVPSKEKQFIFRLLGNPAALFLLKHVWRDLYYYALSKKYFLEGLEQGYNEDNP